MATPASASPDSILDTSAGKVREQQGISLGSFLASLTAAASLFAVQTLVFYTLRGRLPKIYQPQALNETTERWHSTLMSAIRRQVRFSEPDSEPGIIAQSGLDAHFFLRYLWVLLKAFTILTVLTMPILIPLNIIGGRNEAGGIHGLDQIGWSNVGLAHPHRYWVHAVLAIGVVLYICVLVWMELEEYIRTRRKHLEEMKPNEGNIHAAATTVLIQSIPREWLSQDSTEFEAQFDTFPGGVLSVLYNRDDRTLIKKLQKREHVVAALEAAETELITEYAKCGVSRKRRANPSGNRSSLTWRKQLQRGDSPEAWLCRYGTSWWYNLPIPNMNTKSIQSYREEYKCLTDAIQSDRQDLHKAPLAHSAFIMFNRSAAAQAVCAASSQSKPYELAPRYTNIHPNDVIWENIGIGWWRKMFRTICFNAIIVVLVVVFAVPFSFTGLVSQVIYLTNTISWLRWINHLPTWIIGIVQGILPPVILAALLIIFSFTLRYLVRQKGLPSGVAVELSVQKFYFMFCFIDVFLVISVSAGLTAFTKELKGSVSSISAALADNLPKASNYFYSYMLLQALSTSAAALVQVDRLFRYFVVAPWWDRTVRQKMARRAEVLTIEWGTFFPIFTNLACITLIYSIISPLILPIGALTFALFWIVYHYNLTYVVSCEIDSGGLFYPIALKQLLTGVYALELSLIGLFSLVRGPRNEPTCLGQAVVMSIVLILTIVYHIVLREAFTRPLEQIPQYLDHGQSSGLTDKDFERFYTQPALTAEDPYILIPKVSDVSERIIKRAKVPMSDTGGTVDAKGRVILDN